MSLDLSKFESALMALWPHGDSKIPGLRAGMIKAAPVVFPKYKFQSNTAVIQAMAQFSHECGCGVEVVEDLNYRASSLVAQWPEHFTPAQAIACQHNPRLIADRAYNGRMGNRPGTDDGYNFCGHGGSQLTGREEFDAVGKIIGLDLVNHPELVNTPEYFLEVAVADFVHCGCLFYAEHGDIVSVSGKLNVGHIVPASKIIGFSQRVAQEKLWQHAMGS